MTTSYETVLNPGIPEVRQRVVDVCKDILVKYDVDGLVFDDYFYNQDNPSFSLDADLYNAYRANGGTMSQGDWRRENVNQMVKDVNDMVKSTKPWVRFGIGPAGVACTSQAVADQYGVEPCPVGSDWQYNQIYSDPMAWLTRGTVDFLAPQLLPGGARWPHVSTATSISASGFLTKKAGRWPSLSSKVASCARRWLLAAIPAWYISATARGATRARKSTARCVSCASGSRTASTLPSP